MLDGFECWLYQHGLRHMGEIELARGPRRPRRHDQLTAGGAGQGRPGVGPRSDEGAPRGHRETIADTYTVIVCPVFAVSPRPAW